MSRANFIGGNWKCNGTKASVVKLVNTLSTLSELPANTDVVIAPPSLHLGYVVAKLTNGIKVSTQNSSLTGYGAFTGEENAEMIKDFGIDWTLAGHSERRTLFGETNELVAKKTKAALDAKLNVIFCCGESLEDREADRTMAVVEAQLVALKAEVAPEDWANIVIAYEPVWAIGTGKVASPQQAQDVHCDIRKWLAATVSAEVAAATRIIYGGSVKGSNCGELITNADIDGFLVGGASLKEDFLNIIKCAEGSKL